MVYLVYDLTATRPPRLAIVFNQRDDALAWIERQHADPNPYVIKHVRIGDPIGDLWAI